MGSCGIASPSQDHVNLMNPALLPFTEKVNFEIDLRYLDRMIKVGEQYSYENGGGGPAQFSISIPISKKLTTAFGIRPFTNRDFNYSQVKFIGGDSISFASRGSGGTSQAFLSAGFRLNSYISLGLESGYVFGTLEDSVKFGSLPISGNFTFISLNKRRVGQFIFKPGVHIRYPVKGDDNQFFAFGATADLNPNFAFQNYQTFVVKGAGNIADIIDDGSKGVLKRPLAWSFGLAWYKSLHWSANLEYDFWSANGLTNNEGGIQYQNGYGLRLGGEYSPGTKRSTSYFNIITFRGGLGYSQLPFVVDGKSVQDQYVTAGASFPIIRKEAKFTRPILNISVGYGELGNLNSSIGRERYVKVLFGITLNDFLWFNRYRVD